MPTLNNAAGGSSYNIINKINIILFLFSHVRPISMLVIVYLLHNSVFRKTVKFNAAIMFSALSNTSVQLFHSGGRVSPTSL